MKFHYHWHNKPLIFDVRNKMKQVHNSHFIYFRYTLISFFRLRLDIPRRHLTLGLPVRNIIFFPSKMCHMLHKPHYAWICQINNEAPQYTVVTSLLSILLQTQILTIFLQHPVLEHPPLMLTPPPKKLQEFEVLWYLSFLLEARFSVNEAKHCKYHVNILVHTLSG